MSKLRTVYMHRITFNNSNDYLCTSLKLVQNLLRL